MQDEVTGALRQGTSGTYEAGGVRITNVGTPVADTDAASYGSLKAYEASTLASKTSAEAARDVAVASKTSAEAARDVAVASKTSAEAAAAAALNPWQVISPTEIRYIGKGGLYGPLNRLDFLDSNYYIRASDGLEITSLDRVRITAAGGEKFRADVNGVGVRMTPVAGAGLLQTLYRSTVWARSTADVPYIDVVASDFLSLPSYKSVRLQYNGQDVAGNLQFCPSVPAANTAQLEAINTAALVISANNAPVVVATAGAERMRIGTTGGVDVGGSSPTAGSRELAVTNTGGGYAQLVVQRSGTSCVLQNTPFNASILRSYGGDMYVGASAGAAYLQSNSISRVVVPAAGGMQVITPQAFGYGPGAGGTVTQATSKSTAVTLNTPTGVITTHDAALAAGAAVTFTLTNSTITATSLVCLTPAHASSDVYSIVPVRAFGGGVRIRIVNTSGGSLSEAIPINFAVINGASS